MNKWIYRLLLVIVIVWGVNIVIERLTAPPERERVDGRVYRFEDDTFEVRFPSAPEVTKEQFGLQKSDEIRFHVYLSFDDHQRGYVVRVVHYEDGPNVDRDDFLLQIVYQMLSISRDTLLRNIEETEIQGHRGVTFILRDDGHLVGHRAVQVGHTVYLISHIAQPTDYSHDRFIEFASSFRVLAP